MKRQLAVLFASTAMLAACGGSDNDTPAPVPPPPPAPAPVTAVPDSVNASIASFIGYLITLVAVTSDNTEALDVSAVNPPLSETAEPTALP